MAALRVDPICPQKITSSCACSPPGKKSGGGEDSSDNATASASKQPKSSSKHNKQSKTQAEAEEDSENQLRSLFHCQQRHQEQPPLSVKRGKRKRHKL